MLFAPMLNTHSDSAVSEVHVTIVQICSPTAFSKHIETGNQCKRITLSTIHPHILKP